MPKVKPKPTPKVKVEQLTPKSRGVEALYRVVEVDRGVTHLVFFDRFGIYCESHGLDCYAVAAAKRSRKA